MELWYATTAQFVETVVPILPLPPKIRAQSSADPRFQVREHAWGLAEAEVARAARAQARTPFSRPRQKLYLGFPFLGKERQELRRVSERPFGQGAPPLILMLLLDRKQSSK